MPSKENKLPAAALADKQPKRSMLGMKILPCCESSNIYNVYIKTQPNTHLVTWTTCSLNLIRVTGINPLVSAIPTYKPKHDVSLGLTH